MKTQSRDQGIMGISVKHGFVAVSSRFKAIAAASLMVVGAAHAQNFYISQGATVNPRLVAQVTPDGTPSTFSNFADGTLMGGITSDLSGNVYVGAGSSIYKITPSGSATLYGSYGSQVSGLSMRSDNTLFGVLGVASGPGASVGTFAEGGSFTSLTLTSAPSFPFYSASGLKLDSSGNIFVANSGFGGTYPFSVVKLESNGPNWDISSFVSYGTGNFQPFDVATDEFGNVYVSSAEATTTIAKYDSAGVRDMSFAVNGIASNIGLRGITYSNGNLYAVGFGNSNLFEVDPDTGAAAAFQTGFLPSFQPNYVTTAVPEPSQMALMALVAVGGLAFFGGRRLLRKGLRDQS